jgi:hypothetical protein
MFYKRRKPLTTLPKDREEIGRKKKAYAKEYYRRKAAEQAAIKSEALLKEVNN